MDDSDARRILRRHLVVTRRIRALDPRKDSVEFAEGRLLDYSARIEELVNLREDAEDIISTLSGAISVSLKILKLKLAQFNLPVTHGHIFPGDDMESGGPAILIPVHSGPLSREGSGGRTFAESDERNDW